MKNGSQYNHLIANSDCSKTTLGEGDTFHTVDQMEQWVLQKHGEVKGLANQLKGKSLKETVVRIHRFLVENITYKADGALQIIKSPACAWKQRDLGTDCKTFSVFASSILTNLGIPHAIRQVRQPLLHPDQFTHVYVVVPKNGKATNVNGAYHTLDGTIPNNIEVDFIEVKDTFMNTLSHIGLGRPGVKPNYRQGVNRIGLQGSDDASDQGAAVSAIADGVLQSSWWNNTFGAVLANFDLSCFNSAFDPKEAEIRVKKVTPWLLQVSGLNASVNTQTVNQFFYLLAFAKSHFAIFRDGNFANCTNKGGKLGFDLLNVFEAKIVAAINSDLSATGRSLSENQAQLVKAVVQIDPWGLQLDRRNKGVSVRKFTISATIGSGNTGGGSGGSTTGGNTSGGTNTVPNIDPTAGKDTGARIVFLLRQTGLYVHNWFLKHHRTGMTYNFDLKNKMIAFYTANSQYQALLPGWGAASSGGGGTIGSGGYNGGGSAGDLGGGNDKPTTASIGPGLKTTLLAAAVVYGISKMKGSNTNTKKTTPKKLGN
jgi:hypothetical protein